jgi:molybdopterin converting factor small subunit
MQIEVNLFASFKALAGTNKLTLELKQGQTIQDAFFLIISDKPILKTHWLDQNGCTQIYVHIYLNRNDVSLLPSGMQTELQDADILDFIPPVAGG